MVVAQERCDALVESAGDRREIAKLARLAERHSHIAERRLMDWQRGRR